MKCPYCSSEKSKVIDTRQIGEGIRRRRQCDSCRQRFTTYERVAPVNLMVIKADQRREEFDRDKLFAGISNACAKRPVPMETIAKLVEDVETSLYDLEQAEVESRVIGEMVMERLRHIDDVAYVRFASVYRRFHDVDTLAEEINNLKKRKELEEQLKRQLRLAL